VREDDKKKLQGIQETLPEDAKSDDSDILEVILEMRQQREEGDRQSAI